MTEDLPQSFYSEQLTKAMLRQPESVQVAFANSVGKDQQQRRDYFSEKVGTLVKTLDKTDLWNHQKKDIQSAQAHIADNTGDPIAISVIPTGGGKTRIFQEETNALATPVTVNQKPVKVTPRTIQLFPNNSLIRQTKRDYATYFPGLLIGEGRNIQPLTLMTYDLFEQMVKDKEIRPDDIDMLVMDEAHRGLSNNRQDAIKPFLKTAVIRAFTATPIFDSEKNIYTLLRQENEVSRFTYDELIDAGHIAPIVNPILKIRLNGTLPQDADARQKLLRELFEEELLQFYLNFQDEKTGQRLFGKPFAGYVNTIERSKQMAEYFDQGIREAMQDDPSLISLLETKPEYIAEHISGEHSVSEQDSLIERMKNGKTLGVFNDQWMVEGTDIPNLGATLRSPTSSLVVEVQSGGRAGRINPAWPANDPRQTSFVVDVCFELNGKLIGKPRFFFEAINASTTARLIGTPVIDINNEDQGKERKRKQEDYAILDPRLAVNHLLKQRDGERPPLAPANWKSAGQLSDCVGTEYAIDKKIQNYASDKIDAYTQSGMPLEDATHKVYSEFAGLYTGVTGIPVWHISLIGKQEMLENNVLKLKTEKAPIAPNDWISAAGSRNIYVCLTSQKIQAYALEKEQEYTRSSMPEEEAVQKVFDELAGWYTAKNNSGEAWHVSPIGLQEMLAKKLTSLKSERAPLAPPDWKSATKLSDYIGATDNITTKIANYAVEKEGVYVQSGIPEEEAAQKVFNELAGVYSNKQGHEVWHISPCGEHELYRKGILKLKIARAPQSPKNWSTANQLADIYQGSSTEINPKIQSYTIGKEEAYIQSGMPEEEAAQKVFNELAGIYTNRQGQEVWHISPTGIEEMVASSLLVLRKNIPSLAGTSMLGIKAMAGQSEAQNVAVPPIYAALQAAWEAREPVFDPHKKCYIPTKNGGEEIPLEVRMERMMYRIPVKDCGIYLPESGDRPIFAVDVSHAHQFRMCPDIQNTGMLHATHMTDLGDTSHGVVTPIYEAIQRAWEARDPVYDPDKKCYVPTKNGGEEIPLQVQLGRMIYRMPVKDAGFYISGRRPSFAIHTSQKHQRFGCPLKKGTEMLTGSEMGEEAKIGEGSILSIYRAIQNAWEARDPVFDPDRQCYIPTTGEGEDTPLQVRIGRMIYRIPFKDCGIYLVGKGTFCVNKAHSHQCKVSPDFEDTIMLMAGSMAGEIHKSGTDGKKDVKKVYDIIQNLWEARDPVLDPDKNRYIPSDGKELPLTVTIGNVTRQIPVKDCGVYAKQTFLTDISQSTLINELTDALRTEQKAEEHVKEQTNGNAHARLKKSRPSPRRSLAQMSEEERKSGEKER